VRELYRRLDAEGWIDAWLDEEKLFPGMDWNLEIEKAVAAADVILVCLSNKSITKEGYVQRELRIALDLASYKPEGTLFLIPVRLEECEPPHRLKGWQYADYFPPAERDIAYRRLLASLHHRAKSLNILMQRGNDKPLPVKSTPKAAVIGQLTIILKVSSFLVIPKWVKLDGRDIPIKAGITDVADREIVIFNEPMISGVHVIFVEWNGKEPNKSSERFFTPAGPTRVTLSADDGGVCQIAFDFAEGVGFVSKPIRVELPWHEKPKLDFDPEKFRADWKLFQDKKKKRE
jgi:hypothetical protein